MAKREALIFWLLAVVALVYMAAGANAQVTCRSNGGGPPVGDGNSCANYLVNLVSTSCCQENCAGDFCTQMISFGTARARICGNCNQCVSCSTTGSAIHNVVNECAQNGLAAGSDFTAGIEFQLSHT